MNTERLPWIGEDPASQRLFELAQQIAPVPTTILITGESGTGKEYLARLIHEIGPRRDFPYLRTDCAALPAALAESEIFGHERGALPGAQDRKIGLLELARNGTLVLGEVAAMTPGAQEKLMSVLQEQSMERVGGKEPVKVEARVIALTNVDMARAVKEARFREELYYRLDVVKIWVPPLRERRNDILPLAERFLVVMRGKHGRPKAKLGDKVKQLLQDYKWPGNVRELQLAVERAVIGGKEDLLEVEDFPAELRASSNKSEQESRLRSLEDIEREAIVQTLEVMGHQIGRSAEILGISRKTLLEKRKKYRLVGEPEPEGQGNGTEDLLRRGQAGGA
jgi:DNA-binding NtrC family response regulator